MDLPAPRIWMYGTQPLTVQALERCTEELVRIANLTRYNHTNVPATILQPSYECGWVEPDLEPVELGFGQHQDYCIWATDLPRTIIRMVGDPSRLVDWSALESIARLVGLHAAVMVVTREETYIHPPHTHGICDPEYLLELLELENTRALQRLPELSVLLIQVELGAGPPGPSLWEEVQALLVSTLREDDYLSMLGAGTYAVVMPRTGSRGALICADRLTRVVEEFSHTRNVELKTYTGVSSWDRSHSGAQMLWEAGRALKQARRNGSGSPFLYM